MMKTVLTIGANGMLGQALCRVAKKRHWRVLQSTRTSGDAPLDLLSADGLDPIMDTHQPDLVINAAALVDLGFCQSNPDLATTINGDAVGVMAGICARRNTPFVHISTDHFFTGDGRARHDENAPVQLLNA